MSAPVESATKHTIFMLVKTTPTWLMLKPAERFGFLGQTIQPLLKKHGKVAMRFFDAEAFCSRFSDVVMWETQDLNAYQALVEELRETLFWDTYFQVLEIVPAIENAYASHYGVKPIAG